jgi:hypothetical protein
LLAVLIVLWPVFAFTGVNSIYINANETEQSVTVIKKCAFSPPPSIEIGFNIIACFSAYALPLFGFVFWYMSVPYVLRKRNENSLIRNNSGNTPATVDIALKKVTTTVLVLTVVYVLCWSPYWLGIFVHRIVTVEMNKTRKYLWEVEELNATIQC